MNLEFFIHRNGAWIMLMLGESVLSLLIVQGETGDFYKAFFCGIFSISLLELLHFRSQPHDAAEHAYRRSVGASIVFTLLNWIYSAALIVLGTSYKMIQYEYVYDDGSSSSYGGDGDGYGYDTYGNNTDYGDSDYDGTGGRYRMLAGGSGPPIGDKDDRRQRVAHFFCGSLAIVWFCLDTMTLAHKGISHNVKRCHQARNKFIHYMGVGMFWFRLALIVTFATMGLYVKEPVLLSFLGLIGIIVQISLRIAGSVLFYEADAPACELSK